MTQFEVSAEWTTEKDDFENGCAPDTHTIVAYRDDTIFANSLDELKSNLISEYALPDDCFSGAELYEEEPNRIEAQYMGSAYGDPLTPRELKQWKEGRGEAWAVTVTFYVSVTRDFDLVKWQ